MINTIKRYRRRMIVIVCFILIIGICLSRMQKYEQQSAVDNLFIKAACNLDKYEMEMLLKSGADVDIPLFNDYEDTTALIIAAYSGRPDIVRLLLKYGANIHAGDGQIFAWVHTNDSLGNPEVIRLLKEAGAKESQTFQQFEVNPRMQKLMTIQQPK